MAFGLPTKLKTPSPPSHVSGPAVKVSKLTPGLTSIQTCWLYWQPKSSVTLYV